MLRHLEAQFNLEHPSCPGLPCGGNHQEDLSTECRSVAVRQGQLACQRWEQRSQRREGWLDLLLLSEAGQTRVV